MMKKIDSCDQYKKLVAENRKKWEKVFSNNLLLPSSAEEYINDGRMGYENCQNGILFFIDEGNYYRTMFYWNDQPFDIHKEDKPLLTELVGVIGRNDEELSLLCSRLVAGGFSCDKTSYRHEYDLKGKTLEDLSVTELEETVLKGNKLTLRFCKTSKEVEEVEKLWSDHLDEFDIPLSHRKLLRSCQDNCYIVVNEREEVVATLFVQYYKSRSEGCHIVTKPEYHRRGIARLITKEWMLEAKKRGIDTLNTWVSETNTGSLNLQSKESFYRNGKFSIQLSLKTGD